MNTPTSNTRRVVIWTIFLLVAGVCFVLVLSDRQRGRAVARTATMLRSALASDARFHRVIVSRTTHPSVYLEGNVASSHDLQALRTLVERAQLSVQPGISVEIDSLEADHTASNSPSSGPSVFQMRFVDDNPIIGPEPLILMNSNTNTPQETLNVRKEVALDHTALSAATVMHEGPSKTPMIAIELTANGRKAFAELTRQNIGKRLAIVVDGKLLTAPIIRSEIPRRQCNDYRQLL